MAKVTIGYDGSARSREAIARLIGHLADADTVGLRYGNPLLADPSARPVEGAAADYERLGDELCELLIESGVNPESVVWHTGAETGQELPEPTCLIVVGLAAEAA